MADTERDTHFAGFAKLLQQELYDLLDQHTHELDIDIALDHAQWVKQNQLLIARRAYDLVYHTMEHTSQGMAAENEHRPAIAENMRYIPDLTSWSPPESSPAPTP